VTQADRLGRVIVDTSSQGPEGSLSINEATDWQFYESHLPEHSLPGLGHICDMAVRQRDANPGGPLRASGVDVASAFQRIIVSQDLALSLASETRDFVLIPLCLVFGWTKSPQYYNVVSGAIDWAHNKDLSTKESVTYVDDGTLVSPAHSIVESTERHMHLLRVLCGPEAVKEEKLVVDTAVLETLGWILDLDNWVVSPSPRSLRNLCYHLFVVIPPGAHKVPQHRLASLAGLLARCAVILPHSRPFLGHIFKCSTAVKEP